MEFSADYYMAEERAGFYITALMKRAWACQMDILEQIDRICRRHSICYFADWGTMLGAVREQGYIPWDDDLDIGMLRKDYERFRYYAGKELPTGYSLENDRIGRIESDADDVIVHVRNGGSIHTDEGYLKAHHGCPYVLCIDIFIYDSIPDDFKEREYQAALYRTVFDAARVINREIYLRDCDTGLQELLVKITRLTGKRIEEEYPVKQQLYSLLDYISAMYYNEDTQEVAVMGYFKDDEGARLQRSWLTETAEMRFEGMMIPVPKAFHEILMQRYGDYTVPVQGIGADHPYPYFGSQIRQLEDIYKKMGMEIPAEFII